MLVPKTSSANKRFTVAQLMHVNPSDLFIKLLGFFVLIATVPGVFAAENKPQSLSYQVLETRAHEDYLFTQGLFLEDGKLYESSGLYKRSFLRVTNNEDDSIIAQRRLPARIFAEGLTKFENRLYLLTWRRGELYLLNPKTLKTQSVIHYPGEGWGLTHSGEFFIRSDGSRTLKIHHSQDFRQIGQVELNSAFFKLHPRNTQLNELEFVKGKLWANVWQTPYILQIDLDSKTVTGVLDLSALIRQSGGDNYRKTLNGIAYDASRDAFWITGKYWNKRYLIDIQ